jgi:prepilin signal peptidase PulO-like enzyme (type II secretory pathway)
MGLRAMFRPGMRAYIIPLVAGIVLAVSAFLPWVHVGDVTLQGFPDTMALWIIGLGVAASLLATLSLITRKNSRHPLLLVGLVALGIMFLSWQIMPKTIGERALTRSQAMAIVEGRPLGDPPPTGVGGGIHLGLTAAVVLVGFGLTIVVRRASQTYVLTDPDDDV